MVTCLLTVDNEMRYVSYNGVVLQADGQYDRWTEMKTVTFEADSCNPGRLEIRGFNYEGHPEGSLNVPAEYVDTCGSGGVIVSCTAAERNPWNGYGSNYQDWKAFGVPTEGGVKTRPKHPNHEPCVAF